jgi:hypothetical protein
MTTSNPYPWNQPFNTAYSTFNPAAVFGGSNPLSFAPEVFDAASAFGGLGAAASAAAPAAAAGAGAAGASSLAGAAFGPLGLATAGLGFLSSGFGNIAAKNQMEAQLRAQVVQDKRDDVSNYAFQRAFQRANIGDQMQGLQDMRTARSKMGLGRPETFQAFLTAGMPAAAARRESFFNV